LHEAGRRHADDLVLLRPGRFRAWFGDVPTPKDDEPKVRVGMTQLSFRLSVVALRSRILAQVIFASSENPVQAQFE
jgi:hypothetical protein